MAEKKSKGKAAAEADAWGDYESPEQEALRKAQERVKEGGQKFTGKPYLDSDYELMVTKDGDNNIRIVPPIEARELGMFGKDIYLHRNVGPNREVYLCLKHMWGEPCPVCSKQTPELWEKAKAEGEEGKKAKAEAVSYFPEYKILTWVIDRSDGEKLKLFPMPKTIAEEILTQSNRKDTQVMLDVAHPREGRDIYFTRYKDKGFTKYKGIQIGETATPLPAWVAEARKRLDEVLIKPDPEEFANAVAMTGVASESQSSEADASAPKVSEEDDGKDELDRMDMDELKELNKSLGLKIRIRKDWTEEDIRAEIRAAIEPETQTPEETPEETPGEETETPVDPEKIPEDIADCFGVDFDEYQECDDCGKYWRNRCKEETEKAKAKAKAEEEAAKAKAATKAGGEGKKPETPRGEASQVVDRDQIMERIKQRMASKPSNE